MPVAAIAAGPRRPTMTGVDQAHAHPADFGKDDGAGEADERTELGEHETVSLGRPPPDLRT